jgi:hypothetical protein
LSPILRGEKRPQILHLLTHVASTRHELTAAAVAIVIWLWDEPRGLPFGFIETHGMPFAQGRQSTIGGADDWKIPTPVSLA